MPVDPNRIPFLLRESQPVVTEDLTIKANYPSARKDEEPRESFFASVQHAQSVLTERDPWLTEPRKLRAVEMDEIVLFGVDVPVAPLLPTYNLVPPQGPSLNAVLLAFALDYNDDKTAIEVRG